MSKSGHSQWELDSFLTTYTYFAGNAKLAKIIQENIEIHTQTHEDVIPRYLCGHGLNNIFYFMTPKSQVEGWQSCPCSRMPA
jgi:hypothetical protein